MTEYAGAAVAGYIATRGKRDASGANELDAITQKRGYRLEEYVGISAISVVRLAHARTASSDSRKTAEKCEFCDEVANIAVRLSRGELP